jgi:hypothetical protein
LNSSAGKVTQGEIKAKLLLRDDELLAEVGQSLGKGATSTDAIRRGRQVVENLKRELKERVCFNSMIITCYRASETDAVQLVAAIVDVIAEALHGIPPATVAVLLYRTGLATYCSPGWPPAGAADK